MVFGLILVGSFITEIMAFGAMMAVIHTVEFNRRAIERTALREITIERNRVELIEQRGEVDVRVHDDSVGFTVWPCDIPVQTRGYLVSNPAHEDLRVFGTRNLET